DNTQTIQLTPNSNCATTGSGDVNNSTEVQFYVTPNVVCWTVVVSIAFRTMVLKADIDCAVVTYKQGLTVTYAPSSGGAYVVLLSGEIVDKGETYTYTDMVIYMSAGVETA